MNWKWWQNELGYEPGDKISSDVLTLVNNLTNDPDNWILGKKKTNDPDSWLLGQRTLTSRSETNFCITVYDCQPNIGRGFNKEEQALVQAAIEKLIIKKAIGAKIKLSETESNKENT